MARVRKAHNLHTLLEGFGLTMEGRVLSWFQTLKAAKYYSFTMLAIENTKSGLKNDVLS